MISSNREVRDLISDAVQNGWSVERGKKHIKLKKFHKCVTVSITPSDGRAIQNIKKDIRRAEAEFNSIT